MAEVVERSFYFEHEKDWKSIVCISNNEQQSDRDKQISTYLKTKNSCQDECRQKRHELWWAFIQLFYSDDEFLNNDTEANLRNYGIEEPTLDVGRNRSVVILLDNTQNSSLDFVFSGSSWVRYDNDTIFMSMHSLVPIIPTDRDLQEEDYDKIIIFDGKNASSRLKIEKIYFDKLNDAAVLKIKSDNNNSSFEKLPHKEDIKNVWIIVSYWSRGDNSEKNHLEYSLDVFDPKELSLERRVNPLSGERFLEYSVKWFVEEWDSGWWVYSLQKDWAEILWIIKSFNCVWERSYIIPIQVYLDLMRKNEWE